VPDLYFVEVLDRVDRDKMGDSAEFFISPGDLEGK
jgi:hypothetical protein